MDVKEAQMEFDLKAKKVLRCLSEYGELGTTELKERTGLEKHVVNYRTEKLEKFGLVENEVRPRDENTKMTYTWLTDEGRTLINKGLISELEEDREPLFDEDRIDNMEDRMDTMENRINAVVSDLTKMKKVSDDDIDKIRNFSKKVDSMRAELNSLESDFEDMRDYLSEWTDVQENYLEAVRNMAEEEFDKDFEDYL
jgi:DNA-binding MarR family transcriptional regulator